MHTIRLRGPWRVEPVERFVLQRGRRLTSRSTDDLPAAATDDDAGGLVRIVRGAIFLGACAISRTFQKPTGLESGERVWLVVEPPRSRGMCRAETSDWSDLSIRATPLDGLILRNCFEDHNRLEICRRTSGA